MFAVNCKKKKDSWCEVAQHFQWLQCVEFAQCGNSCANPKLDFICRGLFHTPKPNHRLVLPVLLKIDSHVTVVVVVMQNSPHVSVYPCRAIGRGDVNTQLHMRAHVRDTWIFWWETKRLQATNTVRSQYVSGTKSIMQMNGRIALAAFSGQQVQCAWLEWWVSRK